MIEILSSANPVSAFRLSGHLTATDYDVMIADVESRLARCPRIAIYVDATDFTDISPEALAKDFAYSFSHIGDWGRYARMALITDKGWMRALVRAASPLAPRLESRAFSAGEQAVALAWVSRPLEV